MLAGVTVFAGLLLHSRVLSPEDDPSWFKNWANDIVVAWNDEKLEFNVTNEQCDARKTPYRMNTDFDKYICFPKVQST